MNRETVVSEIYDILCDALGIDHEDILPDSILASDLGAESIDLLDITFRVEKKLNVKLSKDDMSFDFSKLTVDELVDLVWSRMQ